ncbi:MAG: hypothetical protein E3J94_03070 [Desulfobacteraceae bacterium]|nr:MAG: hypothetical protein E3J94_03070 [Desulfobacteraceae bacterium]
MTNKEIEIAKRFEGLGLEWIPEVGDKYFYEGELRVATGVATGVRYDSSGVYVTHDKPSRIAEGKYLEWHECEYCVFFPDITRCFEELVKRGCLPRLSFFEVPHEVEGENFSYYSINDGFMEGKKETGVTPREALYKLLSEVMEATNE